MCSDVAIDVAKVLACCHMAMCMCATHRTHVSVVSAHILVVKHLVRT